MSDNQRKKMAATKMPQNVPVQDAQVEIPEDSKKCTVSNVAATATCIAGGVAATYVGGSICLNSGPVGKAVVGCLANNAPDVECCARSASGVVGGFSGCVTTYVTCKSSVDVYHAIADCYATKNQQQKPEEKKRDLNLSEAHPQRGNKIA